jgi:hypothetical protein
LKWLEENWNSCDVFAICSPVGSGKTALARAIQVETGAVVLAPENVLVKQALETYPDINYLIGRKHYTCHKDKTLSCEDKYLLRGESVCSKCQYTSARKRAMLGEATMFNPISYYYVNQHPDWATPEVIVVDEAHKLNELLELISGEEFGVTFKPPAGMDQMELVAWLEEQEVKFLKIVLLSEGRQAVKYNMTLQKIRRVKRCIQENPEQYYHEDSGTGELIVKPMTIPKTLRDEVLKCKKLILMSASLYKSDVSKFTDKPYKYIELDSPISEERRRIIIDPGPMEFTWETSPFVVAQWIKRVIEKYPNRNTIIHVSYSWNERLKSLLPEVLTNTKENKAKVLEKFKKHGGIWLASGCAEGIDLHDELCTLNIIPILPRANIEDRLVRRKMSKKGGVEEYEINVIKKVQQMAGRSTRNEQDFSTVVLSSKAFLGLVDKHKADLPRNLLEQIVRRC